MKRTLLLLSVVFLFSTHSIAQKTINKEDFEQLVDYVNCKYVKSFIEKNDTSKPYFKDYYEKKVKQELEKANLDSFKTILAYEKLIELLSNNTPALELAKKINERKSKFSEFQDNESLINSLVTTGWKNIDLSETAVNSQSEILTKYNSNKEKKSINISEGEVVKTQTNQTSGQVEDLQLKLGQLQEQYETLVNDTKIIEYQQSFKIFRIIVFFVFGFFLLVIIAIYFLIHKRTSREVIIKQVIGSKRIDEIFLFKDNPKVEKTYNLNDKDLNLIVNRVLECIQMNERENQKRSITEAKVNDELLKPATKYLKGKSGKFFSRIEHSPENSFFRLLNENNDDAQFEFCGDESEAIAKRIFSEDICNILSGNYQNANSVKTYKPGKIKRIGEQWEVIEPIEIKLI